MRTIIAGGRNYELTDDDRAFLDTLPITVVLCGMCPGADLGGLEWARSRDIPLECYHAEWNRYGRAAGPIRNRDMARNADAVVLFPGGRGTHSMRQQALAKELTIYDRANKNDPTA